MTQQLGVDDTLKDQLGLLNLEGHGGEKFMSTVNFIFKTHNEAFRRKAAPFEVKRKKPKPN